MVLNTPVTYDAVVPAVTDSWPRRKSLFPVHVGISSAVTLFSHGTGATCLCAGRQQSFVPLEQQLDMLSWRGTHMTRPPGLTEADTAIPRDQASLSWATHASRARRVTLSIGVSDKALLAHKQGVIFCFNNPADPNGMIVPFTRREQ